MKVYTFGDPAAPAILLLPGTCCHWKGNFGHVVPLLQDTFRVLCVSYYGFDETEKTDFPTMIEETEKIEAYIRENCGGICQTARSAGGHARAVQSGLHGDGDDSCEAGSKKHLRQRLPV